MPALRIGVNALYLIPGGVGGTEIYLRSLLAALSEIEGGEEYFIFTNRESGTDLAPASQRFRHCVQGVAARSRPARILWEQTRLPIEARRLRLDVLFNPGFTAPLACPCPQVTVFHDLQHLRHPEHFRWFDLPFWKVLLERSARVSRTLIAVSDATAADLRRYYEIPEKRIVVAPHGVDERFFTLPRRPEKLLLAVSTSHPHKGFETLLRAWSAIRAERPGWRLTVSGMRGFHADALDRLRDELGLDDVNFTGWIPREELYDLFARAGAFVYPSTFEGFGMPVLEALAAGVPTLCSDIEPLRSIAGGAALPCPPGDAVALAAALLRITGDEDLRARLSGAGPERAREFRWSETARITLAALRAAAPR